MIVWLASYPKSGNTLLRSILSTYFFSEEGVFNFSLLKNISQFPDLAYFKGLKVNLSDPSSISKNYINAQKVINKGERTIQFLKTHSAFCKIDGHNFTDLENTLGVIYVVRDPRNVVISQSNHFSLSIDESISRTLNNQRYLLDKNVKTFLGSWSFNYNSWKQFKDKFLLVKYEDLVEKPEFIFLKILKFLEKLLATKYIIDNNKLKKTIETTRFERLKELEKRVGFPESAIDNKTKKKKIFSILVLKMIIQKF